jgi:hypothetical protein
MMKQEASDLGNQIFNAAERLSCLAVRDICEINPDDGTYGIYGALAAVGGTLKTLAELISDAAEGELIHGKATKESMLVAALLAARTFFPWKNDEANGVILDFSARNLFASIEAANKIADADLTGFLNQNMLESYRRGYEKRPQTLGYWDYVPDVGPQFEGMSEDLKNITRH